MKLDAREAQYVLDALIARRKVAAKHVREILRDRDREIAALRHRLAALETMGARAVGKAAGETRAVSARVRRRLSPKVRALRRQQGQYMGFVRRLKAAEKARVRAHREKKGLAAAIRMARSLGRS
ncbi:MAG TPA: hypothetical protein VMH79_16455 [Thermoanaerobaculia bacterium]|nr:hypothetical protein [Thermoanaerobaculia bacterium]